MALNLGHFLLVFLTALGLGWALTALALRALEKRAVLDRPNERSSHTRPTPRGGGWGVVLALLPLWLLNGWMANLLTANPLLQMQDLWVVAGAALALALVSWVDDLGHVPAGIRLAAHFAAVAAGLAVLPADWLVFQGLLPLALDRLAAAFLWVWFINLYNFMDGIDEITGTQTICIALGLTALFLPAELGSSEGLLFFYPLLLAGVAFGFLAWNWHPARVFLGDVGSVPLGFVTGWLLLLAAAQGAWAPALILPAYYLADSGITLGRRLLRGEKVWEAHRQHFYQLAVRNGLTHAQAVHRITCGNVALAILALNARTHPWPALALAVLVVAGLLWVLAHARPATPPALGGPAS